MASILDTLLERSGYTYEELTLAERETMLSWSETLAKNQLTMDGIREYIRKMRDAVEEKLIEEPEFTYIFIFKVPNRRQIFLKARLRNYMLLETFITSPEKAKKYIDSQIDMMAKKK